MDEVKGINLEKIIADPTFSAIVKMTAINMQKNPYTTLKDFFKGLTVNDLTVLNLMVELADTEEEALSDLIVLTEMLSRAEGAEGTTAESARENVNFFLTMVNVASLESKGLVDVIWENVSFGPEMGDKDIVMMR
jgi:hypothetical protein